MLFDPEKKLSLGHEDIPARLPIRWSCREVIVDITPICPASVANDGRDEKIGSDWRNEFWRAIDLLLRRRRGIHEFCSDRHCIIRLRSSTPRRRNARERWRRDRRDSSLNEQLPRLSWRGPSTIRFEAHEFEIDRTIQWRLSLLAISDAALPRGPGLPQFGDFVVLAEPDGAFRS